MGRIFIISGPSGVGKTTFLRRLFREPQHNLILLPRYTDRPQREGEEDGFEYCFTSHNGLIQKLFANDFIHIEKWGDYHSAIESRIIEAAISDSYDAIVLASIFGALRLQATYRSAVTLLYLWTGSKQSLMNARCLEDKSPEANELKWRIRRKVEEEEFSEFETASLSDEAFLNKRMVDNSLDIAAVNGLLRAGEEIIVIPNLRDALEAAISKFRSLHFTISQGGQHFRGSRYELTPHRSTPNQGLDAYIPTNHLEKAMDVTTLAPAVLPYLMHYFPLMIEAGKSLAGKALEKVVENATDEVWKIAAPWIGKLMRKIEDTPAALYAAQRIALMPEHAKYRAAIEVELENILLQDPVLAAEIERMLVQAKTHPGIIADRNSVVFGDNARESITITGEVRGDVIIGDKSRA